MALRTVITIVAFAILAGCAKIGSPTGGPKDVYPPEYISGSPENRSTEFNNDQADIYFNEYIQLKDQNREVIVSPPMKEKPLIRAREKSIRISFNEELLPNTTYTINFGKSISDLNEGNLLPDFEYVFSTGETIDSLSVTGKVVDAFTNEPLKEASMLVMLYRNLSDSAPLQEIPRYYTRANQSGLFAINNIRPDTFRLVALNDANNNLKYDPGLENFAFADSFIIINRSTVKEQTFIKDTIKIITPAPEQTRARRDTTIVSDTLIAPGKKLNALSVKLFSFMEKVSRVLVTSRSRDNPERITITFNRPPYNKPSVEPLNFQPDTAWALWEPSMNYDTITFWLTDTSFAGQDTISLRLTYETTDSAGVLFAKSDTLRLRKPATVEATGRGGTRRARAAANDRENELKLSSNVPNRGTLNLNSNLMFISSRPIKNINPDSIEFGLYRDTLFISQNISVVKDTSAIRKFAIKTRWEEDSQYGVLLKPGAVNDIYGKTNDSTSIRFSTRPMNYYGRILMNFSSYVYPMIVQLKDEKGTVLKSVVAVKPGNITFDYLPPGRYYFKAIYDENSDGVWSTGNYMLGIEPERVFISGKPQQLRSNWDWETSWVITENSGDIN